MNDVALLGDVCQIMMGQAPPGHSYNDQGEGVPLVAGAGDFAGTTPSVKKFTTAPGKVSRKGDIILGIRASIGERVWSDRAYCLGRGVAGLRPSEKLDPNYLWHWLGHSADRLKSKGRGATFLQVNRADINAMEIPLPSLDEQRRIAAILDQADAVCRKRREGVSMLDSLEQAAFHELFGPPATWPTRWAMGTIGEMADDVQYGTASKAGDQGAWPIIRMGNVTDSGRLDLNDLKWINLNESEVARFTVRRGDLLFNRTNSREKVGKTCVIETDERLAFAGYLVRVRLKPGHQPAFVNAYMTSPYGRALRFGMAKSAVNQANINATEMRSIPIALPPAALQKDFADLVYKVGIEREKQERGAVKLNDLFASVQDRAFSGRVWKAIPRSS